MAGAAPTTSIAAGQGGVLLGYGSFGAPQPGLHDTIRIVGGDRQPLSGRFQRLSRGGGRAGCGGDGARGDAPEADRVFRVSHPLVQRLQLRGD